MSKFVRNIGVLLSIAALVLSAYNTYQFSILQQDFENEISNLELPSTDAFATIDELEQTILDLTSELSQIIENQSNDFESKIELLNTSISDDAQINEITTQTNEIKTQLASHLNRTSSEIYLNNYKSVVIINTEIARGSGFIWSSSKYILTNWHVVDGAKTIYVEFYDGTIKTASIVGSDAYSDVAVLYVTGIPTDILPLEFGNSNDVWIGQEVVAIGNPLGSSGSLSTGSISQINAIINLDPLIVPVHQLDVSIAPGSSGGPLLDYDGFVLGITNAGTLYGINYAVPSNTVKRVVSSIIEKGEYRHPMVGFYGITLSPSIIDLFNIENIDMLQSGILVTGIMDGYPAEDSGLQPAIESVESNEVTYRAKDIILKIDDIAIRDWSDWNVYVAEQVSPEQEITLTVWRSSKIIEIQLITSYRERYEP
jgi:S1-C subfamily serine protease